MRVRVQVWVLACFLADRLDPASHVQYACIQYGGVGWRFARGAIDQKALVVTGALPFPGENIVKTFLRRVHGLHRLSRWSGGARCAQPNQSRARPPLAGPTRQSISLPPPTRLDGLQRSSLPRLAKRRPRLQHCSPLHAILSLTRALAAAPQGARPSHRRPQPVPLPRSQQQHQRQRRDHHLWQSVPPFAAPRSVSPHAAQLFPRQEAEGAASSFVVKEGEGRGEEGMGDGEQAHGRRST